MLKGLFRFALLLCAFSSFTLHAADAPHVYTGTMGKMPIVVELDLTDPAQVSGRYFYEKYHTDLALNGVQKGQDLTLSEGLDDNTGKVLPTLRLHQNADAGWHGDWKGPQGKTFKVDLSEQQVPPPAADAEAGWLTIYQQSPYDYLRLKQLPLETNKDQTFMGYTLQWWTEPQSKLSMFQITSGFPPEQLARINQQLRARQWNEVVSYYACLLQGSRFGAEFLQTITPELISPAIVSVSVFTSYDCGGAHPDFGDSPLNLDANTGKPLSLEDVLWVGKGQAFHYDDRDTHSEEDLPAVSFDTFSDYRSKEFAPWLVSQLQTLNPDNMKKPSADDEENCDFNNPEIWSFPAWYFKPTGLYFGPSFSRVMRACESPRWSILPYDVIRQHPGGVGVEMPK
ncbi:MAG: hypothetical protein JWP80_872 [Pseudomonas sp.]|nr:hypothetical protein [Pseudomonas sp.]